MVTVKKIIWGGSGPRSGALLTARRACARCDSPARAKEKAGFLVEKRVRQGRERSRLSRTRVSHFYIFVWINIQVTGILLVIMNIPSDKKLVQCEVYHISQFTPPPLTPLGTCMICESNHAIIRPGGTCNISSDFISCLKSNGFIRVCNQ